MEDKPDRFYTSEVYNVFEILSAHFTHVYYNDLYQHATELYASSGRDINKTEAYKLTLGNYCMEVDKNREHFFNDMVKSVKHLFDRCTNFYLMSTSECIDKVLTAFCPKEFISSIDANEKNSIIYTTVYSAICKATEDIVARYLPIIIDKHDAANAVRVKDIFVDYFAMERDNLFTKFTQNKTKDAGIPVELATAKKYRKRVKDLESKLEKSKIVIEEYKTQLKHSEDSVYKIKTLEQENEKYKVYITRLLSKAKEMESEMLRQTEEIKYKTQLINNLESEKRTKIDIPNKVTIDNNPHIIANTNNQVSSFTNNDSYNDTNIYHNDNVDNDNDNDNDDNVDNDNDNDDNDFTSSYMFGSQQQEENLEFDKISESSEVSTNDFFKTV